MVKTPRYAAALAALIALSACGKYGELEPQKGARPVPVALGQEKSATPDELLTATPQARPGRSVELLLRSERRESDPFDLAPGSQPIVEAEKAAEKGDEKSPEKIGAAGAEKSSTEPETTSDPQY